MSTLDQAPLGKNSDNPSQYSPELLFPIARTENRLKIGIKNAEVGFDFYRTDFQNQAVVDVMNSPQEVLFYNLDGKSFANSLQLDFNLEIIKQRGSI